MANEISRPGLYLLGIVKALFAPLEISLDRDYDTMADSPGVHLVPAGQLGLHKMACFQRAVVPAFLKGRYFIYEQELRRERVPPPPEFPRTTEIFRKRIHEDLGLSLPGKANRLVYLARQRRRIFDATTEAKLVQLLQDIANELSFDFDKVFFEGLGFKDQVEIVHNASLAIGLHGANLVNTIYMPSGGGLVEIFPFRVRQLIEDAHILKRD